MNFINITFIYYLKLFRKKFYEIVKHNLFFFKSHKIVEKRLILVEFVHWTNNQIVLSYLSNFLSKKYKSAIYAYPGYTDPPSNNPFYLFYWKILSNVGKNFLVYRSFGVKKFILPYLKKKQ